MKWLSLIKTRIAQYFLADKLIFVIFMIGSVICGTGFLHMYGNFTSAFLLQRDMSAAGRTFTVGFNEDAAPSRREIGQRLQKEGVALETCLVRARENETKGSLLAVAAGEQSFTSIDGQKKFSDTQMEKGEPVVIIPAVFVENPSGLDKEANTLTIAGTTLQIVGRNNTDYTYYIPSGTFDKMELEVESLMLVTPRKLSQKEDTALLNQLADLFPEAAYMDSPGLETELAQRQQLAMQLVMICVVYGLAVLSFMFLMKYMMDRHRVENVIYCIVGCSKDDVMQITLLENACLATVSALLSVAVHIGLKKPVFDKLSIQAFVYSPRDYLLCFLLMVLVSLLVAVPFILKMRRQSLIMAKNSFAYS